MNHTNYGAERFSLPVHDAVGPGGLQRPESLGAWPRGGSRPSFRIIIRRGRNRAPCRRRRFCPSCHAKRAVRWAEWLAGEVLEPVPHHQWVFAVPKRLRLFFLYDRRLLGVLSRCAWETVRELYGAGLADRHAVPGKEGGRGGTSRGTRLVMRGLVVLQVVVTCVLLIGSLLQMQSILKQQTIDYGYDTEGIMSARMGLMDGAYPSQEMRKNFFDRLVRELRTHSEFEAVALTNRFRMVFSGSGPIEIEGKEYPVQDPVRVRARERRWTIS